MIALIIHGKRQSLQVLAPERWDEMSGAQLMAVAAELFSESADSETRPVRIALILSGLSREQFFRIPAEAIAGELLPLFEWVTQGCDLTAQVLPSVETEVCRLYGPCEKLGNLRFVEFDFAERALHEWHREPGNREKLLLFAATLYRPAKQGYDTEANPEGDVREEFNPNLTARYAKLLETAPAGFAHAVVLWYKGCRAYIAGEFPDVFRQAEGEVSEGEEQPGYFGLMRAIAKSGTYGSFSEVAQMYLYNALMELSAAEQERQALEDAMEEAKRNN